MIKEIFGQESVEYEFIKEFSFYTSIKKPSNLPFYTSIPEYDFIYNDTAKDELLLFLDNCIKAVHIKGVFRVPKKNFLNHLDQRALITLIVAVCTGFFFRKVFIRLAVVRIQIRKQSSKDSILKYRVTVDSLKLKIDSLNVEKRRLTDTTQHIRKP